MFSITVERIRRLFPDDLVAVATFANTPKYILRHFRQHGYVIDLAHSKNGDELAAAVRRLSARKEDIDQLDACAHFVALTLQRDSKTRSIIRYLADEIPALRQLAAAYDQVSTSDVAISVDAEQITEAPVINSSSSTAASEFDASP